MLREMPGPHGEDRQARRLPHGPDSGHRRPVTPRREEGVKCAAAATTFILLALVLYIHALKTFATMWRGFFEGTLPP